MVSALLTPLGSRIKLFLFIARFQIHSEVVKFLCSREVLGLLLFLLKELVRSILSADELFLLLELRLIMFDGAAEMFLMLLVDSNVVVVKVDQRSFLIRCKEVIFPVIIDPFERLNRVVVERW